MKRVKPLIKKSLVTLFGILGIGTLTACYGVVVNYDGEFIEGCVRFENTAVEGITVSVYDGDELVKSTTTDKDGYYSLYLREGNYRIVFEDKVDDGVNYKTLEKELVTGKIKSDEIITFDAELEKE